MYVFSIKFDLTYLVRPVSMRSLLTLRAFLACTWLQCICAMQKVVHRSTVLGMQKSYIILKEKKCAEMLDPVPHYHNRNRDTPVLLSQIPKIILSIIPLLVVFDARADSVTVESTNTINLNITEPRISDICWLDVKVGDLEEQRVEIALYGNPPFASLRAFHDLLDPIHVHQEMSFQGQSATSSCFVKTRLDHPRTLLATRALNSFASLIDSRSKEETLAWARRPRPR